MTTATIGAAKITRIEESYEPNFEAKTFFTDWRDEIVAEHLRLDGAEPFRCRRAGG